MNKMQLKRRTGIARRFLVGSVMSTLMASTAVAKDTLPEVSSDGLHLMKHTKVRAAYVKPGANFDTYTKVKILDCFVQFEKNWERDYNMNEVGLNGRVSDKDAENIKQQLAVEFKKVFTKVLTKGGHEVVDEVGPDVLLLRPAIINLDVTAPDVRRAGMGISFVASAGAMTLYLELYDSATSTLLARVIDPQAAQGGGAAMPANQASNRAAADRILASWARLLEKHMGEVKQQSN